MSLTDVLRHLHFTKEVANVAEEGLFSKPIAIEKIERVL
jgi:hypothetical protein